MTEHESSNPKNIHTHIRRVIQIKTRLMKLTVYEELSTHIAKIALGFIMIIVGYTFLLFLLFSLGFFFAEQIGLLSTGFFIIAIVLFFAVVVLFFLMPIIIKRITNNILNILIPPHNDTIGTDSK